MRATTLRTTLLVPVLLLAACATGTTPGDGGTPDPDRPTSTEPADPDSPTSTEPTDEPTDEDSPTQEPTSSPTGLPASLTIELDETGGGAVSTWTLTCGPAGGDHPDPAAACAALEAAGGAAAFEPIPRDVACTEIWGGPQTAHVEGTVGGVPVTADFARSNGCEIARWDALAPLLGSPGGA